MLYILYYVFVITIYFQLKVYEMLNNVNTGVYIANTF